MVFNFICTQSSFIINNSRLNYLKNIKKDVIKKLGLKVIDEGVETQIQADILKSYGCDIVQGYLYSKPITAEELTILLEKNVYDL